MFIGLTMMQPYFQEKVNVFLALAPVARFDNTGSNFVKLLAEDLEEITDLALNVVGMYDFFAPGMATELVAEFCMYTPSFCTAFL